MELKEFVKETILDIAMAINDANKEASEKGLDLLVNPFPLFEHSKGYTETYKDTNGTQTDRKRVEMIDFDVAVTSSNKTDGELGSSISIAGFKVGAGGGVSDGLENVSRIKFQIPVSFPNKQN